MEDRAGVHGLVSDWKGFWKGVARMFLVGTASYYDHYYYYYSIHQLKHILGPSWKCNVNMT
jgi:hypothetical protein